MKKLDKKIILLLLVGTCCILAIVVTNKRNNWMGENYSDYSIHFSIDDTLEIFDNLTKNETKYSSIFQNDTLSFCKEMHDTYGAVFSFYVFSEWNGFKLKNTTTKFRNEFVQNSEWLRFNFHANDSNEDLNSIELTEFEKTYDSSMKSLIRVVGVESIDKATRLTRFSGRKAVLEYISKDTKIFYTADDRRNVYYFDQDLSSIIFNDEYYKDGDFTFIKTDLRLDNTERPFDDMYALVSGGSDNNLEVFTHEWLLKQRGLNSQSIWKIRDVCKFVKAYHLTFAFN